jgi:hypothetical protein
MVAHDLSVIQSINLVQAVCWYGYGSHGGVGRLLRRLTILCPAISIVHLPLGDVHCT